LGITERQLERLVSLGHVPAYRIGGQFLRFRGEQLDRLKGQRLADLMAHLDAAAPPLAPWQRARDRVLDFLYFNDFYLVSVALGLALLYLFVRQQ